MAHQPVSSTMVLPTLGATRNPWPCGSTRFPRPSGSPLVSRHLCATDLRASCSTSDLHTYGCSVILLPPVLPWSLVSRHRDSAQAFCASGVAQAHQLFVIPPSTLLSSECSGSATSGHSSHHTYGCSLHQFLLGVSACLPVSAFHQPAPFPSLSLIKVFSAVVIKRI